MNLNNNARMLIGNPKFCTADEAISYAEASCDIDCWILALMRNDVSPDAVIQHATKVGSNKLWKTVIAREDISKQSALIIATRLGSPSVLEALVSRSDFDYAESLGIAVNADIWRIWKLVLTKPSCSPKFAVEKAFEVEDSDVWNAILEREDVISYIENLEIKEMLKCAEWSGNENLWKKFELRLKNFTVIEMLHFANKAEREELWDNVLQNEFVNIFLSELDSDEAISLGKEIDHYRLWNIVLMRTDIKPPQLIDCLFGIKWDQTWNIVLECVDVVTYLRNLTPLKMLEYAMLENSHRLVVIPEIRNELINHLLFIPAEEALVHIAKIPNLVVRRTVLQRKDLNLDKATEFAVTAKDPNIWEIVTQRKDFVKKINSLPYDNVVEYVDGLKSIAALKLLVSSKNLSPEKALSLGKKYNQGDIWAIIKDRPDVIEYLDL